MSLRAGFEPAREDPIGFQVQRLNHSAITANLRLTECYLQISFLDIIELLWLAITV